MSDLDQIVIREQADEIIRLLQKNTDLILECIRLRKAVEAAKSLLSEDAMREAGSCFVALQIFDDAVEKLEASA